MSQQQKGAFFVIVSGLFYGLLGYFGISIIKENFSVYNMLFWRFLVASSVIFLLAFSHLKKTDFSAMQKIFCASAVFHAGAASLYFMASQRIGTGLAMVLFYMYPAVVVILNRVFHQEKISRNSLISIFAVMFGAALLADLRHVQSNFSGILIGILAALFFGSYVFSVKNNHLKPAVSTLAVTCGCAFACLVFALLDGSFQAPTNLKLCSNILAMGIICTALPIMCFLNALKHIRAEKAAILAMSEPLSVVFFGFILLGEKIAPLQLLGTAIILVGASITLMEKNAILKTSSNLPT